LFVLTKEFEVAEDKKEKTKAATRANAAVVLAARVDFIT
jgi:hypothetical protein